MSSLNYEILEEIFLEVIKEDTAKSLEKFMLSGKKQFEIAMNHFAKTDSIDLDSEYFGLWVKEKNYQISHDFCLMKPLLSVIPQSIVQLNVGENADICRGTKFFESFIRKDMKALVLDEKLPQEYDEIIQAKTSVQEFLIQYDSKYEDLFLVPSSCKKLTIYMNFDQMVQKRATSAILASVESLIIINEFVLNTLNPIKIIRFSEFVAQTFPNLKEFKTFFSYVNACMLHSLEHMQMFDEFMFAELPSTLTGTIRFSSKVSKVQHFINFLIFGIHDNNFVGRQFKIHDDLHFQFCFDYDAEEDSSDDDDLELM